MLSVWCILKKIVGDGRWVSVNCCVIMKLRCYRTTKQKKKQNLSEESIERSFMHSPFEINRNHLKRLVLIRCHRPRNKNQRAKSTQCKLHKQWIQVIYDYFLLVIIPVCFVTSSVVCEFDRVAHRILHKMTTDGINSITVLNSHITHSCVYL